MEYPVDERGRYPVAGTAVPTRPIRQLELPAFTAVAIHQFSRIKPEHFELLAILDCKRLESDRQSSFCRIGDPSAQVAKAMTLRKTSSKNFIQPANVVTSLPKAAIAALRFGTGINPAKLRPYANKISHFLEGLDSQQEGPIITGLMALVALCEVASGDTTRVVIVGGF